MNFGSLFAGIGGIDLGLERAGMMCAWQVEWDDYCLKVLEKHWPDIQKFGDVKNVGQHNLEPVDLIAGGFPCQPHSVAGKREGAKDNRNLWPEFSRIIGEMRPRYVLAENVPGIITTYLDTVLSDLEGQGYTCGTFNIPACAFDAPHRRERIFIVAYATSERCREAGTNRARSEKRASCSGAASDDVAVSQQPTSGGRPTTRKGNRQERQSTETGRESLQPRHGEAYSSNSQSSGEDVAHTKNANGGRADEKNNTWWRHQEIRGRRESGSRLSYWTVEPDVGRVAHGVPSRVHRLRTLGNAVVPQVAEWIGRRIIEFDDRT